MAKSIKVNQKKRGRPATGRDPVSAVRLPVELTAEVDKWAEGHKANRSEAIRRLVEIGLSKSKAPKRPQVLSTAKQSAARAVELAGKAIDKHSDQNASDDERKVRKSKLIQGPSVFRDARKDRPGK
jgi:metal-responsive CopG/Arc/MetJ family transcriptional regulator